MALAGQQPVAAAKRGTPAAASAAASCVSANSDAAAAAAAAATEQWVNQCCRVEVDAEGGVVTPIPALMAAAVSRLVEDAAISDAAAHPDPPRQEVTRLHGCRPPGISLEQYADRLVRYSKNSPVAYVAAFALMLRLQSGARGVRGGPVRIDCLTAHRMMATGSVVATKFFDDKFFSNHHYAQVAGVSLAEFNAMELDFLHRIDYRAAVAVPELCAALRAMLALAGGRAGPSALLPPAPLAACEAAAAAAGGEEEESVDTSAPIAAALDAAAAAAADEAEQLRACAASAAPAQPALLPWAGTGASTDVVAAEAAAEEAAQRAEPPRRSKKRCSAEAAHPHLAHEERQHLPDAVCQA